MPIPEKFEMSSGFFLESTGVSVIFDKNRLQRLTSPGPIVPRFRHHPEDGRRPRRFLHRSGQEGAGAPHWVKDDQTDRGRRPARGGWSAAVFWFHAPA